MKKVFEVLNEGKKYDISSFLQNHPGGINYVERYRNRDVLSKMKDTRHSQSAFYLLREYQNGGRDDSDEDLENLVDWTKPMLSQVANLGSKYNKWVASPVDRQLRLFENTMFERLTITPWYVVPIVWVPIIIALIYIGIFKYTTSKENQNIMVPVALYVILGIVLWTLLEYSLHRWVFHMEPSGSSKVLIWLHFAIHGLHHKVPFDTRRLVFPPVPAAAIAYAGYRIYEVVFPDSVVLLIAAGSILGYVIYDMIHFYLHDGAPSEGSYLYTMKRYHNQHHFVHHDKGFGISNLYWDQIFGTIINLRKLSVGIRWCRDGLKKT